MTPCANVSAPLVSVKRACTTIVCTPLPTLSATHWNALDCSVFSTSLMDSLLVSNVVVRVNSRLQNTTEPSSAPPEPEVAPDPVGGGTTGTALPSTVTQFSTLAMYLCVELPMLVIWLRIVH